MNQKTADLNMTRVDTKTFPSLAQPELPIIPDRITMDLVERLLAEQAETIVNECKGIVGVTDKPGDCPIACLLTRAGYKDVSVLGLETEFFSGSREEMAVLNDPLVSNLVETVDDCEEAVREVTLEEFCVMIAKVKAEAKLDA